MNQDFEIWLPPIQRPGKFSLDVVYEILFSLSIMFFEVGVFVLYSQRARC